MVVWRLLCLKVDVYKRQVVNPVSDNETGSSEFWGTIMFLISAAALVIGAEPKVLEMTEEAEVYVYDWYNLSLIHI